MRTVPMLILWFLLPFFAHAQGLNEMGAEDIMRTVIARRAEMQGTLAATLRTASVIEVRRDGSFVPLISDQSVIQESAGILFRDREIGARIRITARRQTSTGSGLAKNLIENFQSLGKYFSIDDDEIVLLNTRFVSPLSKDALHYYNVELAGRSTYEGTPVHEIILHPSTRLYPAFEGKLLVSQKSYDLVKAELSPSKRSAIPFIHELRLVQTFSPVGATYEPESLELSGRGSVKIGALGLAHPEVEFMLRGELSDRRTDVPIPDSMRLQLEPIVVADNADSMPASFWSGRSMLTSVQAEVIERSRAEKKPALTFSAIPLIDYNRAGGASLGLGGSVAYGPATIGAVGGYSFGLERPIGEASASVTIGEALQGTLRASAFSQVATTTIGDKSYPRIMNTLVAASLHQDYYDFYRKDGWNAGVDLLYDPLRLSVTLERSQQFSIGNNARWALLTWTSKEFPENPPITDGSYQTVQGELAWGRPSPFLKITPVDAPELRWSLTGLLGANRATEVDFRSIEALASFSIPVIRTGYNPMTLTLLGAAGTGTSTLPPQYQFRLRTSAASFGKPGGFVSPPKGLYGGTEYLALGGELNLTDLPWRAVGLPTYNGRGVELILAGGSARYRQGHPVGYVGTRDLWYSEAGFALSRIPLFLTDIITGRVDLRWGLGPLGRFGGNFTFVAPL